MSWRPPLQLASSPSHSAADGIVRCGASRARRGASMPASFAPMPMRATMPPRRRRSSTAPPSPSARRRLGLRAPPSAAPTPPSSARAHAAHVARGVRRHSPTLARAASHRAPSDCVDRVARRDGSATDRRRDAHGRRRAQRRRRMGRRSECDDASARDARGEDEAPITAHAREHCIARIRDVETGGDDKCNCAGSSTIAINILFASSPSSSSSSSPLRSSSTSVRLPFALLPSRRLPSVRAPPRPCRSRPSRAPSAAGRRAHGRAHAHDRCRRRGSIAAASRQRVSQSRARERGIARSWQQARSPAPLHDDHTYTYHDVVSSGVRYDNDIFECDERHRHHLPC